MAYVEDGARRLGSFSRLAPAWRVFCRDRVNGEIRRIRAVLAEWGYRLGRDDDKLLPMVACQLFLLNRSPHVDELSTDLFDRVRREQLLTGTRLNALHAMPRADRPGFTEDLQENGGSSMRWTMRRTRATTCCDCRVSG